MTAGLIGGRVGNKGAVGISINLSGTTILIINAHLAGEWVLVHVGGHRLLIYLLPPAHEGRLLNRMANLTKIKVRQAPVEYISLLTCPFQSELTVDAFLKPDDPRNLVEGTSKSTKG